MNILNVSQGSEDWREIRKAYDTASEAPAALGQSKYVTRTALLHQKATGLEEEIDSFKQALFDRGHEAEAAARPIAESIIGADLYPVTATLRINGLDLLASLDGATMDEEIIWEHKLYSEELAADVRAGTLSPHYTIQMDQQLLVTGAKKCLFMVSDGTEQNMAYCWYESYQAKFDALIAGWYQFAKDVAEYKPREIVEKPKAEAIMHLPALAVQIRGEVTVSNLPQYRAAAESFIAAIKTDLQTDDDFANAEATVKFCDKAEKDLELTKAAAIAQTASIDELMRTIDYIKEQLRGKRLSLERLVKEKKESIKAGILAKAKADFAAYVADLEAETTPIRIVMVAPDFGGAMKNKRTLASLHDAVDSELADAKIAASGIAKDIRAKLAWIEANAAEYRFLLNDLQQIISKPAEDFQMLVNSRIAQHKQAEAAKLEAERARIAEEERIKAEAKAKENVKAEAPTPAKVMPGTAPAAFPFPTKPAAKELVSRPTDDQIIGALARHFRVHESKVIEWLLAMDLTSASERMVANV